MKICKCGMVVEENVLFCPNCGCEVNENNEKNALLREENPSINKETNQPVNQVYYGNSVPQKTKDKLVAGLLALLLGPFGAHKFYLGYNGTGTAMLLISLLTFGLGAPVMSVISIIEGIVYLTKTDDEFYQTYEASEKKWF